MVNQEESISEVRDESTRIGTVVLSNQKDESSTGIVEENSSGQHWRRPNLFLEIPSRTLEDASDDCVRINMPPTPASSTPSRTKLPPTPSPKINASPYSSSRGKSLKSLLPKLSFKNRNSSSEIEKASMLAIGAPLSGRQEKVSLSGSLSLTKIFTPRIKRTSSLPVTPIAHSNPNSTHGGSLVDPSGSTKNVIQHHITRSLSVPAKERSIRRMDSLGVVFRVIPSTPRPRATEASGTTSNISTAENADNNGADGEDIAEEEAVCRICFVELAEGGDTLKMECSCKGELALAHQECAVKWFSIKGNKTCDICKQEVQNLPVTLLRVQSVHISNTYSNRGQRTAARGYRVWQDVPILVIVSMLAYFCFLEQLLVSEMGTSAIAISLPFSCILGLLASMTSSTMVAKKFVWVYASFQFILVVLFAHIFYSVLHVQSILSILLSTFTGFGLAMSGSSILVESIRWRRRWRAWSDNRRSSQGTTTEPNQPRTDENSSQRNQTDPHETETANPVTVTTQGS